MTAPSLAVGKATRAPFRRLLESPAARRWGWGLIGIVGALLIWQLVAIALGQAVLPLSTATIAELGRLAGTSAFWVDVWRTMFTSVLGFLIALPIALPIGLLIGLSPLAYRALTVLIEILKPIPPIVILPLVVLLLGATERMAEVLIVFTVVPSLVVIVASGVRDTDPVALDTGRAFGLQWSGRVRRIIFPSALPFVATGLRISVAAAVITAVMAEIEAGAPGLGATLNTARTSGHVTETFAYVVALGALGIVLTAALARAERYVLRWHVSIRGDEHSATSRAPRRVVPAAVRERTSDALDRASDIYSKARASVQGRSAQSRPKEARERRAAGSVAQLGSSRSLGSLVQLGVPALLLLGWWVWSDQAGNLYFPPLRKLVVTFWNTWFFADFSKDVVPSLENLLLGLVVAVVSGIVIGTVMEEIPVVGLMLDPIVVFFRSIPGVAYVPIMILLVGYTTPMRVASIALASVFPVLIATVDGLRSVDSVAMQVSRAYGLSRWSRLMFVRLPAAAPRIASGIELSIAVAVVVMVASELEGTSHGIGAQTILAQQSFDIRGMWAGILLLALIGLGLNQAFRVVRLRWLRWYYLSRRTATLG